MPYKSLDAKRLCDLRYRWRHIEKVRAYGRDYTKKNRARIQAYQRVWRNPDIVLGGTA